MIHIEYMTSEDLKWVTLHESQDGDQKYFEAGFYSAFCVAEKSEQEAYDEANRPSKANGDPYYIESCKDRHANCLTRVNAFNIEAEKLQGRLTFDKDLSVIAVSRLLYEEGNNILWQTNTFAFDDPESFRTFNASMIAPQKHKLKRIHIRMNVAIDRNSFDWEGYGPWTKAVVPRMLTPLHNLSILHISFDQYCWTSSLFQNMYQRDLSPTDSQCRMKHDMDALLPLRLLPWKNIRNPNHGKHVTVIISDDVSTHLPTNGSRWTKDQKLQVAEEFRARLAAPNSGEIHNAEAAADQEAKRLKNEKSRRAMIRCLENVVTGLKLKVDGAKEKAEHRRAEAKWRRAKEDDAIGKGLKTVDTLTKSANYHANRAEKAETKYEKLSEKLAGCDAELAKSLADPCYTPNKNVPWCTLHEYLSD